MPPEEPHSSWRSALSSRSVSFYRIGGVACEILRRRKFSDFRGRAIRKLQPGPNMDIIYRYDPYKPIVPRQLEDADAAIEMLNRGHERYVTIVTQVHKELVGDHSNGQVVIP